MFSKIIGLFAIIDVVFSTDCNGITYSENIALPPDHCMGS